MLRMHSMVAQLGIDRLGVIERLELIDEILDSVACSPAAPALLSEARRIEAHRRLHALSADRDGDTIEYEILVNISCGL